MGTTLQTPPRTMFEEPVRYREEAPPPPKPSKPERLVSLDAFRGFIMTILAAHAFGLPVRAVYAAVEAAKKSGK